MEGFVVQIAADNFKEAPHSGSIPLQFTVRDSCEPRRIATGYAKDKDNSNIILFTLVLLVICKQFIHSRVIDFLGKGPGFSHLFR
jgi:hypothetical protein